MPELLSDLEVLDFELLRGGDGGKFCLNAGEFASLAVGIRTGALSDRKRAFDR